MATKTKTSTRPPQDKCEEVVVQFTRQSFLDSCPMQEGKCSQCRLALELTLAQWLNFDRLARVALEEYRAGRDALGRG